MCTRSTNWQVPKQESACRNNFDDVGTRSRVCMSKAWHELVNELAPSTSHADCQRFRHEFLAMFMCRAVWHVLNVTSEITRHVTEQQGAPHGQVQTPRAHTQGFASGPYGRAGSRAALYIMRCAARRTFGHHSGHHAQAARGNRPDNTPTNGALVLLILLRRLP